MVGQKQRGGWRRAEKMKGQKVGRNDRSHRKLRGAGKPLAVARGGHGTALARGGQGRR